MSILFVSPTRASPACLRALPRFSPTPLLNSSAKPLASDLILPIASAIAFPPLASSPAKFPTIILIISLLVLSGNKPVNSSSKAFSKPPGSLASALLAALIRAFGRAAKTAAVAPALSPIRDTVSLKALLPPARFLRGSTTELIVSLNESMSIMSWKFSSLSRLIGPVNSGSPISPAKTDSIFESISAAFAALLAASSTAFPSLANCMESFALIDIADSNCLAALAEA